MTTTTSEPAHSRRPGRIGLFTLAAALTATAVLAVTAPADATTLGTVVEVSGRDGLTEATAYSWLVTFDCSTLAAGRQVQSLLAEPIIDRWYQITLRRTNDSSCNTYGGGQMPTVSENGDLVVVAQYTQAVADRLFFFPLDVGTGNCDGPCSDSNQPVAFATWAIGSLRFPTSGGGTSAPPVVDPTESVIATAVEQAAGLTGMSSLLVSGGAVVPVTSRLSGSTGPRGGVVLEAGGLRVAVASVVGARATSGVVVADGGEIQVSLSGGFIPGTVVEAWLYSTPRLVAAALVPDDYAEGDTLTFAVPTGAPLDGGGSIEEGEHTLQLRMYTDSGFAVLSTGITIGALVPAGVPTGGGPRPLPDMLVGGLLVALLIALMALGYGGADTFSAMRGARVRREVLLASAGPVAGRTLHGFDALEERLLALRAGLQGDRMTLRR
jgi:hypothetical protein